MVLAYRGMQPAGASSLHWYTRDSLEGAAELEETMLFIIDNDGATKIVRRRYWARFVRRVREDGCHEGNS